MTQAISIRMPAEKLAALDRKAADSGLARSNYLLHLVEQDLRRPPRKSKRRFASAHLLGQFNSQGSSNMQARAAVKARSEKNR